MKPENVQSRGAERLLWLVEEPDLAVCLSELVSMLLEPSLKVRQFSKPEMAFEALEHGAAIPDALLTAFYFDGYCKNGLWLAQEARKIHPNLRTAVTSGFHLEHLQGVAADFQVQPDLLIPKCYNTNWLAALRSIFAPLGGAAPAPCRSQPAPAASNAQKTQTQRHRGPHERPLVYIVGSFERLNTLKRCMGRSGHPPRFQKGYDWEHFERPEDAWASLEVAQEKPEALVTDYYLSGGYMNGLKLVRHAQGAVPRIWTVLVSELTEFHIQGIMEGTRISPDMVFHT